MKSPKKNSKISRANLGREHHPIHLSMKELLPLFIYLSITIYTLRLLSFLNMYSAYFTVNLKLSLFILNPRLSQCVSVKANCPQICFYNVLLQVAFLQPKCHCLKNYLVQMYVSREYYLVYSSIDPTVLKKLYKNVCTLCFI